MATDLATRMRMHMPGQVTWPEPELGKTCADCAHFNTKVFKTAGRGRCVLVAGHQGVHGMGFIGGGATACPKFRAGGTE